MNKLDKKTIKRLCKNCKPKECNKKYYSISNRFEACDFLQFAYYDIITMKGDKTMNKRRYKKQCLNSAVCKCIDHKCPLKFKSKVKIRNIKIVNKLPPYAL